MRNDHSGSRIELPFGTRVSVVDHDDGRHDIEIELDYMTKQLSDFFADGCVGVGMVRGEESSEVRGRVSVAARGRGGKLGIRFDRLGTLGGGTGFISSDPEEIPF